MLERECGERGGQQSGFDLTKAKQFCEEAVDLDPPLLKQKEAK